MSLRKNKQQADKADPAPDAKETRSSSGPPPELATEKITLRDASGGTKPVFGEFPGPRNADAALRVAVERRPYADLIAHAKESLEAEVCGVLAGHVCEDGEGLFVRVEAAIRGAAATEASTHVTFTQATWNSIHQTLERDHPKLKIVGWYHTHPGFGVQFSDMDLFIQKNFFSGAAQIALVTDPLSGAVAICVNTASGPKYLPRFWVDGREQPCRVPSRSETTGGAQPAAAAEPDGAALERLEARIGQLVQALDEHRTSYHRFLLMCGVVFCLAVIGCAAYFIYNMYVSRLEPPKLNSYVPVPVQIGDKTVLLGVGVAEWKVPDELNAMMLKMELLKKMEEERAAREAAKNGTNSIATGTNAPATTPRQPK